MFAIPKEDYEAIQKHFPRFEAGMKDVDAELSERKTKFFGGICIFEVFFKIQVNKMVY